MSLSPRARHQTWPEEGTALWQEEGLLAGFSRPHCLEIPPCAPAMGDSWGCPVTPTVTPQPRLGPGDHLGETLPLWASCWWTCLDPSARRPRLLSLQDTCPAPRAGGLPWLRPWPLCHQCAVATAAPRPPNAARARGAFSRSPFLGLLPQPPGLLLQHPLLPWIF